MVKILLAEDSELQRGLFIKNLKQYIEDISIRVVDSGEEIIAACGREEWDLLILDLSLNGKRGDDALAEIRGIDLIEWQDEVGSQYSVRIFNRNEYRQRLITLSPAIILSTSSNPGDVNRAYACGCNAYISKGIDVVDDMNKIANAIAHCWRSHDLLLSLGEYREINLHFPKKSASHTHHSTQRTNILTPDERTEETTKLSLVGKLLDKLDRLTGNQIFVLCISAIIAGTVIYLLK